MAQAAPGCVSKVELSISCSNLAKKDVASKSDPMCVVCGFSEKSNSWYEVCRTEQIKNSENPMFSRKVLLDYYFEEVQKFQFSIYDLDNDTATVKDDDFLGRVECTLGSIVSKKVFEGGLMMKKGKPAGKGSIKITAEEVSDNREITLNVKGNNLDKKDFMGKSDPFLELWRDNGDGTWSLAHRTEVIKNSLDPVWKPMHIPLHRLYKGGSEQKIKIVCRDWDSDGSHDIIGEFYTTLAEIENVTSPKEFPCINEKKKAKKKSYKNSGMITIISSKVVRIYSFLDYIFGGLQINFTVGIDFTGSNGDPRSPDSLHYIHPGRPNEYIQALMAVGNVVQDYDTDKLFPALGFGAKIPPENRVSHEFALNFNATNPYCAGIQGILEAYQQAIPRISLWGPTNISPIINHVARFAYEAQKVEKSPQSYFILLLLTDGVITDMDETRTAIVNASHLPMSIIIVGVGSADFSAMEMLDGDDGVLKSPTGQPVARDIVQFIPFREISSTGAVGLAKAVLAEVPTQVKRYFQDKGMPPKGP